MNDIIGFQFEEIRALDYELELLIGPPNAYVMPTVNKVVGRKAKTLARLGKPGQNVFGNITRSIRNAKQSRSQKNAPDTAKQMKSLNLYLGKRTRLKVRLDVNADKYSAANEDVHTVIHQVLKQNPDTQFFADVLVMIEKYRAKIYSIYYTFNQE